MFKASNLDSNWNHLIISKYDKARIRNLASYPLSSKSWYNQGVKLSIPGALSDTIFRWEWSPETANNFPTCLNLDSSDTSRNRETWNLCGRIRWPSFLWLIFTGPGGAMAASPPWIRYWSPPHSKRWQIM